MSDEKHIEETPEMAKARKAKAALKNVAANTAEIIQANERMANCMCNRASILKDIAGKVGAILVHQYDSNRNYVPIELGTFLRAQAEILERGAV